MKILAGIMTHWVKIPRGGGGGGTRIDGLDKYVPPDRRGGLRVSILKWGISVALVGFVYRETNHLFKLNFTLEY